MEQYHVIIASRARMQLLRHIEFLARVSIAAARRLRDDFASVLEELEKNPYAFAKETDMNLPEGLYRRAIFGVRYKVLFIIEEKTVYLDAVLDCRQSTENYAP